MENCLKTQLKASVNNQSIEKLGCVTLDFLSSSSNGYLPIRANSDVKIRIISGDIASIQGDMEQLDENTYVVHPGRELNTGMFTTTPRTPVKVNIENYYDLIRIPDLTSSLGINKLQYTKIDRVVLNEKSYEIDLSLLIGTDFTLYHIYTSSSQLTHGSISWVKDVQNVTSFFISSFHNGSDGIDATWFSNKPLLTNLTLEGVDNVYNADISVLGNLTSLTTLHLQLTPFTGTVESFVAAQIAAGRTTCEGIAIGANMGKGVTFQGAAISGAQAKILSWTDADHITIANA